jgi:hypothetical protein
MAIHLDPSRERLRALVAEGGSNRPLGADSISTRRDALTFAGCVNVRRDPLVKMPWSEKTVLIFVALLAAMIIASALYWEKTQITSIPSELIGERI